MPWLWPRNLFEAIVAVAPIDLGLPIVEESRGTADVLAV
jgi:hypothetical protein